MLASPPDARPVQLTLQLEEFEGPLDLLLSLIEQRRLPITRVSLAQVAEQYLAQVRARPDLDADLLADFLAIGGKLLLLKSRALLLSEEPDPEIDETAADLEERLETYRIFRAAAEYLQELEMRGERTYATTHEPLGSSQPAPLEPIEPQALVAVLRRLPALNVEPSAELAPTRRASVDERRVLIMDALRAVSEISFRDLAGETVDEVVATFLATLELFRRGLIWVRQSTLYADLLMTRAPAARGA